MTDKEIIIDGVDVNKCYYLRYDHIGCDIDQTYCLGNDCCYKQLKRKEQECEELKKQHEQYKPFYELGAKCTQLNEVADGLSNKCDKYKQVLDEIEEFCTVYSTNHDAYETVYKYILDIINKAKAVTNAR